MNEEEKDPGRFEGKQHGWSPDVDDDSSEAEEATRKAMREPSSDKGAGREVSDAERGGMTDTDIDPGARPTAGESGGRSGEDIAKDADGGTEGYKGKSQRPYGQTND